MLPDFHTALGVGLANAAVDAVNEQSLIDLEKRWGQALVDRDVAALDAILADDFTLIWIDGRLVDKAAVLAGTEARRADIEPFAQEDVAIRFYGQAAVATGQATLKLKLRGQTEICHFRYTEVFARGAGGWQAVSAQSALVCPPKTFFDEVEGCGRAALETAPKHERVASVSPLVEQFFLLES